MRHLSFGSIAAASGTIALAVLLSLPARLALAAP